jgi:hypothetical protein
MAVIGAACHAVIAREGGRSSNRCRCGQRREPNNTGCPAFAGHGSSIFDP